MRIAIITARGGSKRIPRKNIKDFCGKPILAYSVEAAIKSGLFDEVMISTEDEEIASIAQEYGAVFPFKRSKENADDHAGTVDVVIEVINEYKKRGINPDRICCIYPTAPFVTAEKLIYANSLMDKSNAEAVIPVVKFSFPPQRSFIINEDYLEYKWPENEFVRSQDLEPFYHDAGQFYFCKVEAMFKEHTLVPKKTVPYIQSEMEVQDVDNLDDWNIAEIKYKRMIKDEGGFTFKC